MQVHNSLSQEQKSVILSENGGSGMQLDFSSRDGGGFHVERFFGIFSTVFRAFFEAKNAPKNASKNANVKRPIIYYSFAQITGE
jgi:hypothetical protein